MTTVAFWCVSFVGLVFLATGVLKALDSLQFLHQVGEYNLAPDNRVRQAGMAFITLECSLGMGLLVRLSDLLIPAAIGVLLFLIAVTARGAWSGKVEDCGCYGGWLQLTARQSMLLDLCYIALLAVAWTMREAQPLLPAAPALWKLLLTAISGAAGWMLASHALRHGALAKFTLLKTGKRWKPSWLRSSPRPLDKGQHFIVFLSRDCPYCKKWVPLLNVLEVQPDLPNVLGLLSGTETDHQEFLAQHMIRFPLAHMPKRLMKLLVDGYPTAALVEDGIIRETWFGELPKAYMERIRQFFDSLTPAPVTGKRGSFSG